MNYRSDKVGSSFSSVELKKNRSSFCEYRVEYIKCRIYIKTLVSKRIQNDIILEF